MRIFILLLFLLCAVSCKKGPGPDSIIPRETFKKILIDFHQIDAYYSINYDKTKDHNDSINFYNQILKEYGYKKAEFDSTFSYYTRHAEKFDRIYEEIITELQKMEQEGYMLHSFERDTVLNLYKGKKCWQLPHDGIVQKIPFSIPIKDSGKYSITVQLKLLPLDNAKNPRLTAYFWYNDGSKEGFRDYFNEVPYNKTKRLTVYSTSKERPNKKVTHIKGWILNYDDYKYSYRFVDLRTIIVSRN
jgi:hypothetical protein